MANYLLSVYQPTGATPPPEDLEAIMADINAVNEDLRSAGAWVFAGGLHEPHAATVLRPKDDEILTTDGPFTEGKEHLGGFTVIDVADLDEALRWGERYARATTLPIEVRPFSEIVR